MVCVLLKYYGNRNLKKNSISWYTICVHCSPLFSVATNDIVTGNLDNENSFSNKDI